MNRPALWMWTAGVSLATGALTLYVTVKKAAVDILRHKGAFNEAVIEADQAIRNMRSHSHSEARQNEGLVHTRYNYKKREIIHKKGVDTFAGAWKSLSPDQKTKSLTFATVASVVMGAITYAAIKPAKGKHGSSNNSDNNFYYWGDGGSDSGGHDHGSAWGGDFGGGGGGDFGGSSDSGGGSHIL